MKEVFEKLEAIEVKLTAIHRAIDARGTETAQNFGILQERLKLKIDEIKKEIIEEIKGGK
jgi:hypothetical protein